MPSSSPHPDRSASPAATGSAPPPEPRLAAAGHTGLPLSIWPGVPGPGRPPGGHLPPCPGHCPGPGARLVITTFSRPGDLVAVIPRRGVPGRWHAALAGTGRRLLGVTAGPPGPAERAGHRASACRGGASPGAACGAGQAALAVTLSCDGLPADGANPGQAAPYPAGHRALRPGGLLAVLAGRPAAGKHPGPGSCRRPRPGRRAGLRPAHHPHPRRDRRGPPAPPPSPPPCRVRPPAGHPDPHRPAHLQQAREPCDDR